VKSLVAVTVVAAAVPLPWAVGASAPVTLHVREFEDPNLGSRGLTYSGTVASRAAGEKVSVVARVCPRRNYQLVTKSTTQAGGAWRAETAAELPTATFRARWRGRYSRPVRVWTPLDLRRAVRRASAADAKDGAVTVFLDSSATQQNLNEKIVELQRYDDATGSWIRQGRANLRRSVPAAFTFTATFRRLRRGLVLRIVVPKRTGLPCYLPQVSHTFGS
jgi:hypothetical protein